MKTLLTTTVIALIVGFSLPSLAADGHDHAGHSMAQMPAAAAAQLVDGTVKKIDKAAGEVVLSHGELTNLGMPAMTMAFHVKNTAWLDQLKQGDKIRFKADMVNSAITVVQFEPAK